MASQQTKSKQNSVIELIGIVAVALGLAWGIQQVLVKPFRIPSGSMEHTLNINQRVLVDRVSYRFSNPSRGDIVVFHPPKGALENTCGGPQAADQACDKPTPGEADTNFIKRVVGVPGDQLYVKEGYVYRRRAGSPGPFKKQDESFVNHSPAPIACPICDEPKPITVPPGHYFMMGDNRGESADSREWGPVPKDSMVGHAFFTYWPPDRLGPL